jgi:hypothetical protein
MWSPCSSSDCFESGPDARQDEITIDASAAAQRIRPQLKKNVFLFCMSLLLLETVLISARGFPSRGKIGRRSSSSDHLKEL